MATRRRRVALVLGAGGSVGHAYHLGVLSALSDALGWDARAAELIVGTSAGSVVGAGLRAGLSAADMRARALGKPLSSAGRRIVGRGEAAIARVQTPTAALPETEDEVLDVAARLRRFRMASPERVLRAFREPWRVTAGSLFSAVIPEGRLPTEHLGAPYEELFGETWPARLWIVAVKLDVGSRVVFGRDAGDAERTATVGQAVQASCAVPGYFAPVTIAGERYVDGGVHSTTNADLAAPAGEPPPALVLVSAPMSPEQPPGELTARSAVRQLARRWLQSELAGLRARGVDVVSFQPTPGDVAQMAGSSMDPGKGPAVIEQVHASTVRRLEDADVATALSALHR